MIEVELANQPLNPVDRVKPYFSGITDDELEILVGTVLLLGETKLKLVQTLLNKNKLTVEEWIGRLVQSDLLDGYFTVDSFVATKLYFPIIKQDVNLTLDERVMMAYMKARIEFSLDELQKGFGLSYESVIHILARFLVKGLISVNFKEGDTVQVFLHYRLRKKDPKDISNSDKDIIGYGMLRDRTTFSEISQNLEIPEHKVQSTIVDMILSDLILCKFELTQNLFQGTEVSIEVGNFMIIFPQRSILMMSEVERILIGVISLRRIISLREVMTLLKIPRAELLGIIARLTATNEFPTSLSNKGFIKPIKKIKIERSISIEDLSASSLFNYRVLLGILTAEKEVSMKSIQKKMKVERDDILRGIIDLYLTGHISGFFKSGDKFILESVDQSTSIHDVVLEIWERILLGALISEGVLPWPKIAVLLDLMRDSARDKVYSLISKGLAKIVVRDTAVTLLELPSLPPLVQIEDLPRVDQQLLGVLMMHDRIKLKDLRTIFDMSSSSVYKKVYGLLGSGLIDLRRTKNTFIITRRVINEPTIPIKDLEAEYSRIIQVIEEKTARYPRVDLKDLLIFSNIERKRIIRILGGLVGLGYYEGILEGNEFVKKKELVTVKSPPMCFECGTLLDDPHEPCPGCESIAPVCMVCKGVLTTSDFLVGCPFCEYKAHTPHLTKWLTLQEQCPICKKRLSVSQLIKIS